MAEHGQEFVFSPFAFADRLIELRVVECRRGTSSDVGQQSDLGRTEPAARAPPAANNRPQGNVARDQRGHHHARPTSLAPQIGCIADGFRGNH